MTQSTNKYLPVHCGVIFVCVSKYLFAEFSNLLLFFLFFNQLTNFKIKVPYMKDLLHKTSFFVIQADSMPEMPPETVTEEQYTDEHGHTVVKKVLSVKSLATFLLSYKVKNKYSHIHAYFFFL